MFSNKILSRASFNASGLGQFWPLFMETRSELVFCLKIMCTCVSVRVCAFEYSFHGGLKIHWIPWNWSFKPPGMGTGLVECFLEEQ